jgi:hypothetical protein
MKPVSNASDMEENINFISQSVVIFKLRTKRFPLAVELVIMDYLQIDKGV